MGIGLGFTFLGIRQAGASLIGLGFLLGRLEYLQLGSGGYASVSLGIEAPEFSCVESDLEEASTLFLLSDFSFSSMCLIRQLLVRGGFVVNNVVVLVEELFKSVDFDLSLSSS